MREQIDIRRTLKYLKQDLWRLAFSYYESGGFTFENDIECPSIWVYRAESEGNAGKIGLGLDIDSIYDKEGNIELSEGVSIEEVFNSVDELIAAFGKLLVSAFESAQANFDMYRENCTNNE